LNLLFFDKRLFWPVSLPKCKGDLQVSDKMRSLCVLSMHASSLQDLKMVMRIQVQSNEESQAPGLSLPDPKQPSAAEKPQMPDNHHPTGSKQVQMQRSVKENSLLLLMVRPKGTMQARPWCLLWFLLERWLKKVLVIGSTVI